MHFWRAISSEPLNHRAALCRAAEQLGFTGVALGDHLVTPAKIISAYPYRPGGKAAWNPTTPFPEPFQVISAMAMVTTKLRFMTSIYILPLRDTFTVAKALSTAAVITDNRVTFGVGVGWMKEEFDLTGQSFTDRGGRTDEMLEVISALLEGGMVEFHGRYHDFEPVQMSPVPTAPVPVVVGGESNAALRRAAKAGGWMTAPHDIDGFRGLVQRFRAARAEIGLDDTPPTIVALVTGAIDVDACRRLEDEGVTDIVLSTGGVPVDPSCAVEDRVRALEAIAETIIGPMT